MRVILAGITGLMCWYLVFFATWIEHRKISAQTSLAELSNPAGPINGTDVEIDGSSLKVSLPPEWELGSSKLGFPNRAVIRYKGQPGFELAVSQITNWPSDQSFPTALPFECDYFLSAFRGKDGNASVLSSRPDYFPQDFYSRVLIQQSAHEDIQLAACLYLGNSNLTLALRPIPNAAQGAKIAPVLQAIVEGAKQQSTLLYGPGQIHLPALNVTVSFSSGAWSVGAKSFPPLGTADRDLLVRTGGAAEMKVMPILSNGNCSNEMKLSTTSPKALTLREHPPYLSSNWEPVAFEIPFPPESLDRPAFAKLQITACRQLEPATKLLVLIWYGSEQASPEASFIAKSLDELADAVLRTRKNQGGQPPVPLSSAKRVVVDKSVQAGHLITRVQPTYPILAQQTRVQGTVRLHVIIGLDGTALEVQVLDGHPLLIQAAIDAVKQWRYQPTLVEGRPAEVDTEIDVIFSLAK